MVRKVGYLTIDDSPTDDFLRKVDYLVSKNIPAIFFCRGDYLENRKDDAITAIKKGFVIGNHSYDHPHFSEIPLKESFQQIRQTDEIINDIYKEANVSRPAKIFRFPYGDKGSNLDAEQGWPDNKDKKLFMRGIQNYLKKLGYSQPIFENISYKWYKDAGLHLDLDVYWTYYTFDCEVATYKATGKEEPNGYHSLWAIKKRMDEDVPDGMRGLNYRGSNDIILMHDYPSIEDIFHLLIEALLEKGLYFKLPLFSF
ncbi:MAG: polysaccharide deacetylase family protein [Asgard group archaeon]|nr:polysaccharide deacetylase family protein [Asgard group archaeon]